MGTIRIRDSNVVRVFEKLCQHLNPIDELPKREIIKKQSSFSPLDATIRYSSHREVVEFVPAYEEITAQSRKIRRSVGLISELKGSAMSLDDMDLDSIDISSLLAASSELDAKEFRLQPMGPVGHRVETGVFELLLPRSVALENYEQYGELPMKQLESYLVSMESVMKLAVAMTFEVDEGDFAMTHHLSEDTLNWYVYSTVNGSPIAEMVYTDFSHNEQEIWNKMKEIVLESQCCQHFCERCILLPRTPEYVIRKGLLNKSLLRHRWS